MESSFRRHPTSPSKRWLLLLALLAGGCDGAFVDPAPPGGAAFTVLLTVDAAAGGPAEAFDQVDRIRVQVTAADAIVLDSTLAFSPRQETRLRFAVDPSLAGGTLRVDATLMRGSDRIFVGTGTGVLDPVGATPIEIALSAVVARLEAAAEVALPAIQAAVQLTAEGVFATGDTVRPPVTVTWSLLDAGVIELSSNGLARALAEGVARARASHESVEAIVRVRVRQDVASVRVMPETDTLFPRVTAQFTAQPLDANGFAVANRTVSWSSEDTQVLTVSPDGVATGVSAGIARVIATADGVPGSALVTVLAFPPPAAPTGFTAVPANTTVTLTWIDNAADETSHLLLRRTGEAPFAPIAMPPANATSYLDETGQADTRFEYFLRSCNASDCTDGTPATAVARTIPIAPSELMVSIADESTLETLLTWRDNSAQEDSFRIQREDDGSDEWVDVEYALADSTSALVPGSAGRTSAFRVFACNAAGCAGPSNEAQITYTLPVPVVMTEPSTTLAEGRGTVNGFGALHEVWFEYGDSALVEPNTTDLAQSNASGPQTWRMPFESLSPNSTYYYRILARNAAGTAVGQILTMGTPDLLMNAPPYRAVCNGSSAGTGAPQPCPVNPSSVTFTATSSGPSGTYQNPYSSVAFVNLSTGQAVATASVTLTDNGITRTYTYTGTWTPAGVPAGTVFIGVRGYGPTGGYIATGFEQMSITID